MLVSKTTAPAQSGCNGRVGDGQSWFAPSPMSKVYSPSPDRESPATVEEYLPLYTRHFNDCRVPFVEECAALYTFTITNHSQLSGPLNSTPREFKPPHITRDHRLLRAHGLRHFHYISIDCYDLSIMLIKQPRTTENKLRSFI